jgi:hypothetical protein
MTRARPLIPTGRLRAVHMCTMLQLTHQPLPAARQIKECHRPMTATPTLLGVELTSPTLSGMTVYALIACALWVAIMCLAWLLVGAWLPADLAGGLLLVAVWSAVSNEIGIRARAGARHVLLLTAGNAVLLGLYALAMLWV